MKIYSRISRALTILVSIILLFGCSDNINYSDHYVFSQDSQYNFINGGFGFECIAESEYGYYFMDGPCKAFLFFYDKAKKQAVPLCNKPNCLHTDETDRKKPNECNALIGSVESLKYYMGQLYYVIGDSSENGSYSENIFTISPDGTNRKVILKCREYIRDMQIHRGAIYFSTTDMGVTQNDGTEAPTTNKLFKYDMNKAGAKPEVIFEGSGEYGNIDDIICYGNNLFFDFSYVQDKNFLSIIYKYSIQTELLNPIIDKGSSPITIFNGNLVYFNKGIYACDFNGNNIINISDAKGLVSANDNYLFIDNALYAATLNIERTLTIIDKNWKTIKTISLDGIKLLPMGCSNEFYFLPDIGGSNEYGEISIMKCVPVGGSIDDMEVTTFFEFIPKVPFIY